MVVVVMRTEVARRDYRLKPTPERVHSGCQARAGWLSGLRQTQSEPNEFHYSAGVETGFTRPVGLPDGGLVVSTYARLPVDLGPAFDGVIVNPIGAADAVVAGYAVPWIRGCATTP